MPREEIVIIVRRHVVSFIWTIVLALVSVLAAAVLSTTIAAGYGPAQVLFWLLAIIAAGYFAYRYLDWRVTYFVVTNNRLILITGLFRQSIGMLPLTKVTDMRMERTLTGRSLGYAQFVVESAGQDQALRTVSFVPYPVSLYQEILGMIFPEPPEPEERQPPPDPPPEPDPGF
jgi:uncharacterized membrane protein YdbT with pleckstrin-like domain